MGESGRVGKAKSLSQQRKNRGNDGVRRRDKGLRPQHDENLTASCPSAPDSEKYFAPAHDRPPKKENPRKFQGFFSAKRGTRTPMAVNR